MIKLFLGEVYSAVSAVLGSGARGAVDLREEIGLEGDRWGSMT